MGRSSRQSRIRGEEASCPPLNPRKPPFPSGQLVSELPGPGCAASSEARGEDGITTLAQAPLSVFSPLHPSLPLSPSLLTSPYLFIPLQLHPSLSIPPLSLPPLSPYLFIPLPPSSPLSSPPLTRLPSRCLLNRWKREAPEHRSSAHLQVFQHPE